MNHFDAPTEPMRLQRSAPRLPAPEVTEHYGEDARALWAFYCERTGRDDICEVLDRGPRENS